MWDSSPFIYVEPSIDKLANGAIQATTTKLKYWMAGGIQEHGSTTYGFRKRSLLGLHRPVNPHDTQLWLELLYADHKGKIARNEEGMGIDRMAWLVGG